MSEYPDPVCTRFCNDQKHCKTYHQGTCLMQGHNKKSSMLQPAEFDDHICKIMVIKSLEQRISTPRLVLDLVMNVFTQQRCVDALYSIFDSPLQVCGCRVPKCFPSGDRGPVTFLLPPLALEQRWAAQNPAWTWSKDTTNSFRTTYHHEALWVLKKKKN